MKSRCFIALVFLTVGRRILPGYFWETVLFSDDWTKLLLASFMLLRTDFMREQFMNAHLRRIFEQQQPITCSRFYLMS